MEMLTFAGFVLLTIVGVIIVWRGSKIVAKFVNRMFDRVEKEIDTIA